MGTIKKAMEECLREHFSPSLLEITDESEAHRGHAGSPGGGESHFHVRIQAPQLAKLALLQRHRAINKALAPFLKGGVHALRISCD